MFIYEFTSHTCMVEFHEGWYNKFVRRTNEKDILLNKIFDLIDGYSTNACLEIGLGTSILSLKS